MRKCPICNKDTDNLRYQIKLSLLEDINLNDNLNIYFCESCYFYFTDSNNNQNDYNMYYKNFNNYNDYIISLDKEEKCSKYLINNLDNRTIKKILDYGCGNNILKNYLNSHFENIDFYDINMNKTLKKYDCIVVSHVLEHIYDLDAFITNFQNLLNNEGYIYIEVPNMEYYENIKDIGGPLQEINLEHINFFSKYGLSKLMIKHNYITVNIIDDFFIINNLNYYVIRGLFKKTVNNNSFNNYLEYGSNQLNNIKPIDYDNLYIYGCGQLLFKVFIKFNLNNIINIVDDNKYYLGKYIKNKKIINFENLQEKIKDNDNIFITTIISSKKIINKLINIKKNINIYYFNNKLEIIKV
jgi:hypothetical protein